MAESTRLLEAMLAEQFGDVRRLNEEVERLRAALPGQLKAIEEALPASVGAAERRLAELAGQLAQAEGEYRAQALALAEEQGRLLKERTDGWFRSGTEQALERIREDAKAAHAELRRAIADSVRAEIVRPLRREVEGVRHDGWKIVAAILLCNLLGLCAALYGLWHFKLVLVAPAFQVQAVAPGLPSCAPTAVPRQAR